LADLIAVYPLQEHGWGSPLITTASSVARY